MSTATEGDEARHHPHAPGDEEQAPITHLHDHRLRLFVGRSLMDAAGVDVILVGDSASNVMAGHETTLPITLDQMIYHASSVVRGCKRALVVVDLPFGTYQGNSARVP
jgi:hypothetical protein